MRSRQPIDGFTLLEVLVVLMITGMVAAILFQGLGNVLAIRSSVAGTVLDLRTTVLQRNIILDPVRGVIPDHNKGDHLFTGDGRTMRGITIRPLGESTGAPRPFELSFDYDSANDVTRLIYRTTDVNTDPQLVASWRGNQGQFAYHDINGGWHEAWPPPDNPKAPQIPWLIGIQTGLESNGVLVAYLNSPHERILRMQDFGFGPADNP